MWLKASIIMIILIDYTQIQIAVNSNLCLAITQASAQVHCASYQDDCGDQATEHPSIWAKIFFYAWLFDLLLSNYLFLNILIDRIGSVLGLAMACSNTFGLVTGAFLLGFGLSEIPKSIWKNADWTTRQKVLSHKIAKMAVKLDDAHQELSNAIVVSVTFHHYLKIPSCLLSL